MTNVYWFRATGGYICGCGRPSNLVKSVCMLSWQTIYYYKTGLIFLNSMLEMSSTLSVKSLSGAHTHTQAKIYKKKFTTKFFFEKCSWGLETQKKVDGGGEFGAPYAPTRGSCRVGKRYTSSFDHGPWRAKLSNLAVKSYHPEKFVQSYHPENFVKSYHPENFVQSYHPENFVKSYQ